MNYEPSLMKVVSRKVAVLTVCLLLTPLLCTAGPLSIPGFDQQVFLQARGERPNDFVRALFHQIGVPVTIEGEIDGLVQGTFEGSAEEVFGQVSEKYKVYAHFNQAVAHVYKIEDISEKLLPMSNAKAKSVTRVTTELGLLDARNKIRLVSGLGLELVGSKRFLQTVEELALNVKTVSSKKSSKPTSATKAKAKPQLVVREFRLKYAKVDDEIHSIKDREITIPGVVSTLQQFVNRNQLPASVVVPAEQDAGKITSTGVAKSATNASSKDYTPLITAYSQTNSVWIQDTAERMAIYQNMIDAMDKKPHMVEIEATIIDINNTRQQELGINWRAIDGNNQFLLGNGTSQDLALNPGQQITPQGVGGILSLVMGDRSQFLARIRALENVGAASVVSKPHVITSSNLPAVIGSTTEFSVRLQGKDAVSLEDKSFGTILHVTPRVIEGSATNDISLDISIEDGSAPGGRVDNIPEIERSHVDTKTVIQQGQSLLIGGLIRESTIDQTSKVPLIGDIPLIGKLFQTNGKNVTKMERLFLITPRVIKNDQNSLQSGPVLLGKMDDIISSSDHRNEQGRDQVKLKTKRQTSQVNGKSAFHEPVEAFKNTILADHNKEQKTEPTKIGQLLFVPSLSTSASADVVATPNFESLQSKQKWQAVNSAAENAGWQVVSE